MHFGIVSYSQVIFSAFISWLVLISPVKGSLPHFRICTTSTIIGTLEANGFIDSIRTSSNLIFYQITSKGLGVYSKWVKDFLDFVRLTDMNW